MIISNLHNREVNVGFKFTPNHYKNNIAKTYYDSSEYLNGYKIDSSIKSFRFSHDGNYMATVSYDSLYLNNLNNTHWISKPKKIKTDLKGIFNVVFTKDLKNIVYGGYSYANNKYNLELSDTVSGLILNSFSTQSFINDISMNPVNSNVVTCVNYGKEIYTCDSRSSEIIKIKVKNLEKRPFYSSVQYQPNQENIILFSTRGKNEVFNFDLRNMDIIMYYELPYYKNEDIVSAYYNQKGTQILVTKSEVGPILFGSEKNQPLYEFDDVGYYGSFLKRSCCFAGIEDEYVVAGSKNFDVYIWEIPKNSASIDKKTVSKKIQNSKFVLKGHTSKVENVHFSTSRMILASLEENGKLVFWSPLKLYFKNKEIESFRSNDIKQNKNKLKLDSFWNRFLFINSFFVFGLKNQFNYNLKKVFYTKNELAEKLFEENSVIQFIHSFIIQLKIDLKLINLKLLKNFKEILLKYSEKNLILNVQYLSIYYDVLKVFKSKVKIKNSLDFLKLQISLCKKNKKKLAYLVKKKSTSKKLERLKSLKKIILIMKAMVYDLIIIFNLNKELYEISFELVKKIIQGINNSFNIESKKSEFLESIFKDDYRTQNDEMNEKLNENKLEFNNKISSSEVFKTILTNDLISLNKNLVDENFEFCLETYSKSNLKLLEYYNDDFLLKLSNSSLFKKNFKTNFNYLK